ncbi:MAG TPA: SDR family oxidoreductase [Longimicrobiaceae bacterium]|nr:SDR family oxidoreductase [Longimicrobiaceae bacterium]
MNTGERVLVVGATRGTGRIVAQRLLQDGHPVRVVARNPARAIEVLGSGIEVVEGDVTRPASLVPALERVGHVVYTAGVTHRPAGEAIVKATVYDGVLNAIAAAKAAGFGGRFLLMGAVGTTRGSPLSFCLNLIKGNTLRWRRRAEEALRGSGLEYTIVHAGILTDSPPGLRAVELGQAHHRMWPWHRIGRADAAEVLVQALGRPEARNATFDAVWAGGGSPRGWDEAFRDLEADGSGGGSPAAP